MKNSIIVIALLMIGFMGRAQKSYIKFGNVSDEELKMEDCSFYEGADAMVLAEIGDLRFQYDTDKGWQYVFDAVVRKKIINKTGKDQGSIKIALYDPIAGGNREQLTSLKATTYNLENGKVTKDKLENSAKFETRINKYWKEVSFTMPNLKDGSVFEYRMEIVSDYISNLRTWGFQDDIPIAYSEFNYIIPEYFNYQSLMLGGVVPMEDESDKQSETFLIEWREMQSDGSTIKHSNEMNSLSFKRNLIAKDIPPIEIEPYMVSIADVPARIEFQLVSVQFPRRALEVVAGTYESFNEQLLKSESFGQRLDNGFFAKDWVESVAGKDPLGKAASIHSKARNHFVWDKVETIWSDEAGRNAYTDKNGSVADINLSLVAAYKAAGLNAHPVILSTREHGSVHPLYPNYDEFNYVVAAVVIDDVIYLADAASNQPFGKLPAKCLNGKGWMVSPTGGWVNLQANNPFKTTAMIQTQLVGNKLVSSYDIKAEDYAAQQALNETKKDKDNFENDIKELFTEGKVGDFTYDNENSMETFKYGYTVEKEVESDDIIYLQPFTGDVFLENPFKRDDRKANIDFMFNYFRKGVAIIEIPEGYTVELPEAVNMKLPNGEMSFKYNVVENGNTLNVISDFRVKKVDFAASEYKALKEFFQMMVEKNNQLIVLKK